jgi:hypothetical protein
MSSVTIWTAVCVDCQPSISNCGLKTRTLLVPGVRSRAKLRCENAAP